MFGAKDDPAELRRCDIALFDPDAWQRYFDFETLRALEAETRDEAWSGRLRDELNRFCNEGDPAILGALYEHRNATHAHELAAIGHAHIDSAWLWPLAETYRKLQRSLSSQLRYMEDYPEYRFACSQAQQYAWVKERDPELWGRLRGAVERGQFVPVGGSWVEPDCNLPSGESLVRQFLHGQRWFEREFGRRHREFWSPDAFGYAGQLPQILREAGITRFLTQKLSWNRFNRPEHHTLMWQGDDGSEVLAHYPPADTYNSEVTVPELLKVTRYYRDHDHARTSLLVYGYGDGGGGPTRRCSRRCGAQPTSRACRARRRAAARSSSTRWSGKAARGRSSSASCTSSTTAASTPRRRARSAATGVASRRCTTPSSSAVPAAIIPAPSSTGSGSCSCCSSSTTSCRARRSGSCTRTPSATSPPCRRAPTRSCRRGEMLANTVGFARREVVGDALVEAAPFGAAHAVEPGDEVTVDGLTLENAHLRVTLSPDGSALSVLHKESGREALAAPGNRLELYDDRPVAYDAWDIDPSALETRRDFAPATSWSVSASPLRAEITFERPWATQVVRLDAGSRRSSSTRRSTGTRSTRC